MINFEPYLQILLTGFFTGLGSAIGVYIVTKYAIKKIASVNKYAKFDKIKKIIRK